MTAERRFAALLGVGEYIGGINRIYYFKKCFAGLSSLR
jgi:hypothetical protein